MIYSSNQGNWTKEANPLLVIVAMAIFSLSFMVLSGIEFYKSTLIYSNYEIIEGTVLFKRSTTGRSLPFFHKYKIAYAYKEVAYSTEKLCFDLFWGNYKYKIIQVNVSTNNPELIDVAGSNIYRVLLLFMTIFCTYATIKMAKEYPKSKLDYQEKKQNERFIKRRLKEKIKITDMLEREGKWDQYD